MAFDAFISYSSQDKAAADVACGVLEGAGVRCWIAPRDIRTGAEYGAAIIDAIDHCRVMVLVFSSSANASRQIHREIERAVSKGVPIMPVRIEEVTPTKSMEYFLGAIHWMDALTPPLEQHLHKLAETVKAMLKIEEKANRKPASGAAIPKGTPEAIAPAASALTTPTELPKSPGGAVGASEPSRRRWLVPAICAAAFIGLLVGGCLLYRFIPASPTNMAAPSPVQTGEGAPTTLRAAAEARGFLMGASAKLSVLQGDAAYAQTLTQQYNLMRPETEMWFTTVHPSRTEVSFESADRMVDYASQNGMKMVGQGLVWPHLLPKWLTGGKLSSSDISAILKDHIQSLIRRYHGRMHSWIVVDLVFDNLGKMRDTLWSKALGPDYVQQAFLWAREADPSARLFLLETLDLEPRGAKSDALHELLRNFRARSTPIDGIILYTELLINQQLPKLQDVAWNMNRLATLGLDIHQNLNVGVPVPPTEPDLQNQATVYRDYLTTCLSFSNCKAFITSGFSDRNAYASTDKWKNIGYGAAMPFDAVYRPKPAFQAMLDVLINRKSIDPN
jgi:endo-1,4-beta-xylanase